MIRRRGDALGTQLSTRRRPPPDLSDPDVLWEQAPQTGNETPEWVNVKDEGATGGGTVDDTATIDAAIVLAANTVCYFPPGTYLVSGITLGTPNVTLWLEVGATLELADASDAPVITVSADGVSVLGGEIDCNRLNQTATAPGIHAPAAQDNLTFSGIYIHSSRDEGIKVQGGGANCLIENNRMDDIVQTAIIVATLTEDMPGLRIEGNNIDLVALGTGQLNGGIKVQGDVGLSFNVEKPRIVHNNIKSLQSASMPANAVQIETLYNVLGAVISGNVVEGGSIGITAQNQSVAVTGNTVTGPWNIGLEGFAGAVFMGNTVEGGTAQTDVGLSASGAAEHVVVTGNTFKGCAIDGVKLQDADFSTVTGNTIEMLASSSRVVRLISSQHCTISGNVLDGTTGTAAGVLFDSSSNATLDGNIILGCTNAFRVTDATDAGHIFNHMIVTDNLFDVSGAAFSTGFGTGGWGQERKFWGNIVTGAVFDDLIYRQSSAWQAADNEQMHKWQHTTSTNEMHVEWHNSGDSWVYQPQKSGTPDAAKEFFYDFVNERWTFDTNTLYIGSSPVAVVGVGGPGDADTLDGEHGAFYQDADNLNAGTVATARLGSGTANSSSVLRGDQEWAAVRGTTFPSTPADGREFYRTDLNAKFWYDSGRSKWLGEIQQLGAGVNGSLAAATYLNGFDGMVMSATLGWMLPNDITIVGMSFAHTSAVTGNYEARRSGVAVSGASMDHNATSGADMSLDANVAASGILTVYNTAGTTTSPQVLIFYRRHAT